MTFLESISSVFDKYTTSISVLPSVAAMIVVIAVGGLFAPL